MDTSMKLFQESLQAKQKNPTLGDEWRRRPIMPSSDHFEIPAEMRAFAERSFEQAKFAFDKFMDATQSTMNAIEGQSKVTQAATKEVSKKIMNFAEQNVASAFDYAQKLVRAKDPQTLLALHSEFISSQMQVLCAQTMTLGDLSSKVATDHRISREESNDGTRGREAAAQGRR
jgi:phasin